MSLPASESLGAPDGETAAEPVRPLPRIFAVANQKGGVGKTTTAVNLGASLADLGYRTLVIDLDPQGNATTGLGIDTRNLETSMYDVIMHDVPARGLRRADGGPEPLRRPGQPRPGRRRDRAGPGLQPGAAAASRALEAVVDDYDFVLIDCPPSLGLLTVNGLAAADEVLVPIQCEYYALEGLGQLLRNVELVRKQPEPDARGHAPSSSSCTTPGPSWPTRSCQRGA